MIIREFHPLSDTLKATGVAVITTDDIRWGRCDIKSINLLGNVLARQQGKNAGAFETIFLRDGRVIEGATSNVMVVREGSVMTAPEGTRILSGVTRNVVLELARTHGIAVHEQYPSQADLHEAEEVLLTGTTVEIMPVVTVNGKAIGTGKPGRITKQLAEWFRLRTG
jgi:D-alanine transaminase